MFDNVHLGSNRLCHVMAGGDLVPESRLMGICSCGELLQKTLAPFSNSTYACRLKA